MIHTRFSSVLAILAAFGVAAPALAADRAPDRKTALARLDSAADEVRAEMNRGPRIGARERHDLRRQLASIGSERDRLAAGGSVDAQELASLTGDFERTDRTSKAVISNRVRSRQAVTERRLGLVGPRLGAMERIKLRDDLDSLEALIADLESGKEIDLARVDRVIGLMAMDVPQTPEQRREALGMKRATYERRLNGKQGAAQRLEIREEIDRIDRLMQELESGI
jgi:hypothetical protein